MVCRLYPFACNQSEDRNRIMPRPLAAIRRQTDLRRNRDESIASARTRGSPHFASIHPTTAQRKCEFSSRARTLHNSGLFIVAADCYRAHRVFSRVVTEFQLWIIQEASQSLPQLECVFTRFGPDTLG